MAPRNAYFELDGPAGDDDAVDAERGQRQDVQQAGIDVRQHQPGVERKHRPGRQRRHQRQHRREQKQQLVGAARNDDLLEHQLDGVGDRLQPTLGPDPVRPHAHLHVTDDLALGEGEIGHQQHQRCNDHHDLDQNLNHDRQGVPEVDHHPHQAFSTVIEPKPRPSDSLPGTALGNQTQPLGTR